MGKPAGPKLWDEFGWNDEYTGKGATSVPPPKMEEPMVADDPVNEPAHYNVGIIEAITYMEDSMSHEAFEGYLEGSVKKYLHRFKYKGKAKQDLQKARWYLERLIEHQE